MSTVVCMHLRNDYSGSPRVLSQVIKALRKKQVKVIVHTARDGDGFLSNLDVDYVYFDYRWSPRKVRTLLNFTVAQARLFVTLLRYRSQPDVTFYVNTLLPIAGGIAGRFMGKRVIYHIHESSLSPRWFKAVLRWIAARTATRELFVSRWLLETERRPGPEAICVPNGLSDELLSDASSCGRGWSVPFGVLMLCSLRGYKGVEQFLSVASLLEYDDRVVFDLVLSASDQEVNAYFRDRELPHNVRVHSVVRDVASFYRRSHLLLNLSLPEAWIETFGLTILEGMAYGLPSIVPPVGGPVELVMDGETGFLLSPHDVAGVAQRIGILASDAELYRKLSAAARERALQFSNSEFERRILDALEA